MNFLLKSDKRLRLKIDSTVSHDVLNSFLITELNFKFNNNGYELNGMIDPNVIESIVDFFNEMGFKIELDEECQKIYNKNISTYNEFKNLERKGFELKKQNFTNINIPNLIIPLKNYQLMPVMHAFKLGNVANFSVPGSGKTWMAYSTYFLNKQQEYVNKLLIIGPLSSFKPWEFEYENMTGKKPKSIRISGSQDNRRKIYMNPHSYDIFLMSYNIARIDKNFIEELLKSEQFMIVVDESHHIKNPKAGSSRALLYLSKFANKKLILSGTPLPNSIDDLWSQFTFLYPDGRLLGNYNEYKHFISRFDSPRQLYEKLNSHYTRISKKMMDLPIPSYQRITVTMSPIQERIYDAIKGFIKNNDPQYREDAMAVRRWRKNSMIYLLEAATDPSLLTKKSQYLEEKIMHQGLPIQELIENYNKYEKPTKIIAVKNLANNLLLQNKKIIIWCSFIPSIKKLSVILKKHKPILIWGAVPKDDDENESYNREREIDKFINTNHNLLIANPASLAESISLHKTCHHAIYLDRTFNAGHYLQSLDRIHRIGMGFDLKTKYTIFISKNTIDHTIDERLNEKKERMLKFLNDENLGELNLDLTFNDLFGNDDDVNVDYKRVLDNIIGNNI